MSYLGVSASLTGRQWVGPSIEVERAAEMMAQSSDLPASVCQVLARRGVPAMEAKGFLAPTLKELLPDPRSMKDMEVAAARFLEAVRKRQRIAVFADYDVDGGSSAALLIVWLREMGLQATLYVPDRIDEGYGPNVPAMQALARDHNLIICVDCGTLSHEPIAAAKGADVIVLDHHLGGETLPDCVAVVNPNRQDESGDLGYFCAAGVVFLMLVEAGRRDHRKTRHRPYGRSGVGAGALRPAAQHLGRKPSSPIGGGGPPTARSGVEGHPPLFRAFEGAPPPSCGWSPSPCRGGYRARALRTAGRGVAARRGCADHPAPPRP